MKKYIKYLLIAFLFIGGLSSCETYSDDYKKEYSPIFPICGEWIVDITDATTSKVTHTVIYTYDTADKDANKVWLWINVSGYGTKCKIDCDPGAGTFNGAGAANVLLSGTNDVTNGKVVINGATTPSSGKSDSIECTYFSSLSNKTYSIKGYRRTGWPEDE